MLSVKEQGILEGIIKHCDKILQKTSSIKEEDFVENEDLIEVVCFNILQIGELAKNFEPSFTSKYNKVPWKQIKGMRDKVAHGYDTIDVSKIWNTAKNDIKPLLDYCNFILALNPQRI